VLTVNNAALTLYVSDRYNADRLKRAAMKFIDSNFREVMDTPGMKKLQREQPILLAEFARSFRA
jgi:hypothetical protein